MKKGKCMIWFLNVCCGNITLSILFINIMYSMIH